MEALAILGGVSSVAQLSVCASHTFEILAEFANNLKSSSVKIKDRITEIEYLLDTLNQPRYLTPTQKNVVAVYDRRALELFRGLEKLNTVTGRFGRALQYQRKEKKITQSLEEIRGILGVLLSQLNPLGLRPNPPIRNGTLSINLDIGAVVSSNPDVAQILYTAACFAGDSIPGELMTLQGPLSQPRLSTALELLKDNDLIIPDRDQRDAFTVCPIVRRRVRQHLLEQSHLPIYMQHTVRLLSQIFSSEIESYRSLMLGKSSIVHAKAVWDSCVASNAHPIIRDELDLATLLFGVCHFLRTIGRYEESHTYAEKALRVHQQAWFLSAAARSVYEYNLAASEFCLGNTERAISIVRPLEYTIRSSGPSQRHRGRVFLFGVLLLRQGHYELAESYQRTAIRVIRETHEMNTVYTLDNKHNLACILVKKQKFDEALSILRLIIEARKGNSGQERNSYLNNPKTLASLDCIGIILQARGNLEEASRIHIQVLHHRRRLLGDDHADTIATLGNLSTIYRARGDFGEAARLSQDCFEFFQRKFGEGHEYTLNALENLGNLARCRNRILEAETLTVDLVRRKECTFGGDHVETLRSQYSLSVIYQCQARYGEALELGRLVRDKRKALPLNHPDRIASETHVPQLEEDLMWAELQSPFLPEWKDEAE